MKSRKYYSAESAHGSASSMGFVNDTIVRVFDSKSARDEYVANSTNISVQAISRSEATNKAANWSCTQNRLIQPKPFTGQFWGIVDDRYSNQDYPAGQIGTLEVACEGDPNLVDRFY